ncbi:hypothetical protein [Kitasatospora sp. GP82]|uniref:hypothetical protein n=1 Tax=Kitasatospora sp. GP82 TaxID=3035089 RepID=UPI00247624B6|nr:hypothetical protein [Kitasatospora sp. GP82]MDH6129802.1 hypothetical protein [Kitasatospora sp. GP82]
MDITDGQDLPNPRHISAADLGRVLLNVGEIGPELTAHPVTPELRLAQLRRVRGLAAFVGEAAGHLSRTIAPDDQADNSMTDDGIPSYDQAYAQAPELDVEIGTLARMRADLDPTHRPAHYPPVSTYERREILLRHAAADDRVLHQQLTSGTADEASFLRAESSADLLLQHDLDHADGTAGPYGPDCARWRRPEGALEYVRQEYLAWLTRPDVPDLYV